MPDLTKYVDLITDEHADKPKFLATVAVSCGFPAQVQEVMQGLMGTDFDLDVAIGDQLDTIGLWVGMPRQVKIPLSGVYFSFDIDDLGFDQGVWKGPFDPDTGIIVLPDDVYRQIIKAKIAANNWDGTMEGSKEVLDMAFLGTGTLPFIQDGQDMSMVIGLAGTPPSKLFQALISGGYISVKPAGVRVSSYIVTPIDGPIFGFDVDNAYIGGFDNGLWGQPI